MNGKNLYAYMLFILSAVIGTYFIKLKTTGVDLATWLTVGMAEAENRSFYQATMNNLYWFKTFTLVGRLSYPFAYPPLWAWTIHPFAQAIDPFADPYVFLLAIRTVPLVASLAIGTVLWRSFSCRPLILTFWFLNLTVLSTNTIQFDMIPMLFMIISYYFFSEGKFDVSATLYGVGIAYKIFPIYHLPIFLWYMPSATKRLRYLMLALAIPSAVSAPYLLYDEYFWPSIFNTHLSRGLLWGFLPVALLLLFAKYSQLGKKLTLKKSIVLCYLLLYLTPFYWENLIMPQYSSWFIPYALIDLNKSLDKSKFISFNAYWISESMRAHAPFIGDHVIWVSTHMALFLGVGFLTQVSSLLVMIICYANDVMISSFGSSISSLSPRNMKQSLTLFLEGAIR